MQHDAVSNLRKAKSLYMSRHQEYDKVKEQAAKAETESQCLAAAGNVTVVKADAKAEKKKKQEDDALQKVCASEARVNEIHTVSQTMTITVFCHYFNNDQEFWGQFLLIRLWGQSSRSHYYGRGVQHSVLPLSSSF